jgi:isopenicillin-N N-acyltransferase like protein
MSGLLGTYHGNLTIDTFAHVISPLGQTGDLHAAIFEPATSTAYFSNARKTYSTAGSLFAYDRQFTRLDMAALFAEKE